MTVPDLERHLGPRVSIVSTFPPAPDGIARYAGQLADTLADTHDVLRLGLGGGGDRPIAGSGPLRLLRVLHLSPRDRTVLVNYHANYLTGGRWHERVLGVLALMAVRRLRDTATIVHEPDELLIEGVRGPRRLARQVEELLRRTCWRVRGTLLFHSEPEELAFVSRYGLRAGRTTLGRLRHGSAFHPATALDRAGARRRLELEPDVVLLLCIGFLSTHKGFDRALAAFRGSDAPRARLWIIGSPIRCDVETRAHADELALQARRTPRATLLETYLDDEDFDVWLTAADVVLTPYRRAASSSVVPRAQQLGARVLSTAVGGMAAQLRPGVDIAVADDAELAAWVRALAEDPAAGVTGARTSRARPRTGA